MKRFYQQAAAAEAASGFTVVLDGRPIRTPAKAPFIVPALALAEAIAKEWAAQGQTIDPETMPLMRLAATAIDQIAHNRAGVVQAVAAYAGSDLLCYRAEGPETLVSRQHHLWQPILDWAALRFDAPLRVVSGIIHQAQPDSSLAALNKVVQQLDLFTLSGVQNAVGVLGSLILTLALLEGRISADEAFEAAELDASFQIEQWGEDAESTRRRVALQQDIQATQTFLALLKA